MSIAMYILIGLSLFFSLAGVVGMLRMPDAYCRMQSSTNISTLGILGVVIAGIVYCCFPKEAGGLGDAGMAVKLAVLGIFYIVTAPISGHAIAKAAYKHGVKACAETVCDKLGEDMVNE